MALIAEFQPVPSTSRKLHGPVTCGHRTFTVDGQRILQLDTYGSAERMIPDKISQSIQLNAESAHVLLKLITDSFPNLAR